MSLRRIDGCGKSTRGPSRRAFAIIYVGLAMLAMFAVVSLAVDLGRVRVARLQLSTAADAAALAGVQQMPAVDPNNPTSGSNVTAAKNAAVNIAGQNVAIQGMGNAVPVSLTAGTDIECGYYNTTTGAFTLVNGSVSGHTILPNECNAVHVTARRTGATAVGLFFARIIGKNEMDITAQAFAYVRGGRLGFGIVALDSFSMNGNTYTDSYDPAAGAYGGSNKGNNGSVASNGSISMVGTSDIYGDARPGVGKWVSQNGNTNVHGWITPLEQPLVYPAPVLPGGMTRTTIAALTGASKKGGTAPIPGGATFANRKKYWVDEITTGFSTTGYVEFWVDGEIGYTGGQTTGAGNPILPEYITINGLGSTSTTMDLGGGSDLYAHVYAPTYDCKFHGTGHGGGFFGWIICKTMDLKGNSEIHYDGTLPDAMGPRRSSLFK